MEKSLSSDSLVDVGRVRDGYVINDCLFSWKYDFVMTYATLSPLFGHDIAFVFYK